MINEYKPDDQITLDDLEIQFHSDQDATEFFKSHLKIILKALKTKTNEIESNEQNKHILDSFLKCILKIIKVPIG